MIHKAQQKIVYILGFFLPIFPQISIACLAILGLFYISLKNVTKKDVKIILSATILFTFFILLRSLNFLWLLYFLFYVFSFLGVKQFLRITKPNLYLMIFFGCSVILSITIYNLLASNKSVYWQTYPSISELSNTGGKIYFYPLTKNSRIATSLGYVGPGAVDITLSLRAENRPSKIAISLQRKDLNYLVPPMYCHVTILWRRCTLRVLLKDRIETMLLIGGWDTWTNLDSPIQVRDVFLNYETSPKINELLFQSGRSSGLVFNPNAFGFNALLSIFLIFVTSPKLPHAILWSISPAILIIFSGSRNSLVSLAVFALMNAFFVFLNRFRFISVVFVALVPFFILFLSYSLSQNFSYSDLNQRSVTRIIDPSEISDSMNRFNLFTKILASDIINFYVGDYHFNEKLEVFFANAEANLTHPHNLWIELLGFFGIFVTLFFLSFFFFKVQYFLKEHLKYFFSFSVALYTFSFFDTFILFPSFFMAYALIFAKYMPFTHSQGKETKYG
jgi:Ca2+/Na+ antiporter